MPQGGSSRSPPLGPCSTRLGPGCPQLPQSQAQPLSASPASAAGGAVSPVPLPDHHDAWAAYISAPGLGSLGPLRGHPTGSAGDSIAFLLLNLPIVPLCVTEEQCSKTHLDLEETQPACTSVSSCGERTWQGQDVAACVCYQSQTRLSIPLPKQELGSQDEVCLKAFRELCWPHPSRADGFFPWEGPSASPRDTCRGSKLLHSTPAGDTPRGAAAVPGELGSFPLRASLPGHPSWQAGLGDRGDGWRLRSGRR